MLPGQTAENGWVLAMFPNCLKSMVVALLASFYPHNAINFVTNYRILAVDGQRWAWKGKVFPVQTQVIFRMASTGCRSAPDLPAACGFPGQWPRKMPAPARWARRCGKTR